MQLHCFLNTSSLGSLQRFSKRCRRCLFLWLLVFDRLQKQQLCGQTWGLLGKLRVEMAKRSVFVNFTHWEI
jgi:hypothetical protein